MNWDQNISSQKLWLKIWILISKFGNCATWNQNYNIFVTFGKKLPKMVAHLFEISVVFFFNEWLTSLHFENCTFCLKLRFWIIPNNFVKTFNLVKTSWIYITFYEFFLIFHHAFLYWFLWKTAKCEHCNILLKGIPTTFTCFSMIFMNIFTRFSIIFNDLFDLGIYWFLWASEKFWWNFRRVPLSFHRLFYNISNKFYENFSNFNDIFNDFNHFLTFLKIF